jgi:hypothetical protein
VSPASAGDSAVLAAMQGWLSRAVIGLNLCPFAKIDVNIFDLQVRCWALLLPLLAIEGRWIVLVKVRSLVRLFLNGLESGPSLHAVVVAGDIGLGQPVRFGVGGDVGFGDMVSGSGLPNALDIPVHDDLVGYIAIGARGFAVPVVGVARHTFEFADC